MSVSDGDGQSGKRGASICRIIVTEDDDAVRERFVRLIADWDGGELVAESATLSDTLAAIRDVFEHIGPPPDPILFVIL